MPALRFLTLIVFLAAGTVARADGIAWQPWSEQVFAEAARAGKLVILDMEAVWCHWCHVMDETTYQDPAVVTVMNEHFIAVKVDQDGNPALSQRYEDWGWPATVMFDGKGRELDKERGYVEPAAMAQVLQALVDKPEPIPEMPASKPATLALLSAQQKQVLGDRLEAAYDSEHGGWGNRHKFLQADALDYLLMKVASGDATATERVRQTMGNARAIIDPVWGGIFQYSDDGTWNSPHYEKIMSSQANAVRLYATAYALLGDQEFRAAAEQVAGYMLTHLKAPEGSFYPSQDADLSPEMKGKQFYALNDQERRKLGEPRIDRNLYAREAGWAISALVALHEATGEQRWLDAALDAARWAIAQRWSPEGGWRHDNEDRGGPFMTTNLAMANATLDLYRVTADRMWLGLTQQAADFMTGKLEDRSAGGFALAPVPAGAAGVMAQPVKHFDDNTSAVRFYNALAHYTGDARYGEIAKRTMAYLAGTPAAGRAAFWPGLLQADAELAMQPLHMTVVGKKGDETARALYRQALTYPATYRRIEWLDQAEGALPNPDVTYPTLDRPALFACIAKRCSLPIYAPEEARQKLDRLFGRTG
ncbi:MAG TPA: DUF255 domain-containing protein [Dongiaceae bacterium]|jgi:hypothetical protein|nr:DUF255 domain-containing protein [Dongiaceae bacterium]